MISCLIIEDEPRNVNVLKTIITLHCHQLKIEGIAGSVKEALSLIGQIKPQLLFLDVELGDGNAFDLLSKIDYSKHAIIFTTAHEEYALTAFRFSAVDYLVKPLSIEDVVNAVARAVEKIGSKEENESIKLLLNQSKLKKLERIALPTLEGLQIVELDRINYIEAEGSYSVFYLISKEKQMVSKSLKEYEELLEPYRFFRIHHSHIIQLNKVDKYVKGSGGYVVMQNGVSLDVSARKKDAFLQKLHEL